MRVAIDLDGTLIDTLPHLTATANRLLSELGRPPVDPGTYRGFVGHGMARQVKALIAHTGGGDAKQALGRFLDIYAADPVGESQPYPGVADALTRLAARCRLAVCTQKPVAQAEAVLVALGLRPAFETVIGGDSTGALKPDPRMLHAAVGSLGDAPIVMIGDSMVDRDTAAAGGARFLWHRCGYGTVEGAEGFDHWSEVPALLLGSG